MDDPMIHTMGELRVGLMDSGRFAGTIAFEDGVDEEAALTHMEKVIEAHRELLARRRAVEDAAEKN